MTVEGLTSEDRLLGEGGGGALLTLGGAGELGCRRPSDST